jgi:hypothetical protein
MPDPIRTVTLLTDFGLADYFVAAMKGVMLGLNPALRFVDISHLVPQGDIRSGAFTLGQSYHYFPPTTIHLAVVDPGVGTARKAIVVSAGGHYFVGPDNGLLSGVLEREADARTHEITADHYFRKPVSMTFHGRDVFAPIAAWVSRDIPLHQIGPVLDNPVRLPKPVVKKVRDNLLQGEVQAVDAFGNLITNIRLEDLSATGARSFKVMAGQREITTFRRTFGDGPAGEVFIVPGSAGFLEIVTRGGSAASTLSLAPGATIGVLCG